MATHYLARYSASTVRLREVLARKIRRRCELRSLPLPEAEEIRSLIDATVERLTRVGLLDDAAFGRGRVAALARKGWPVWRIKAELHRQGIAFDDEGVDPDLRADETSQAMRLAQRKRLGPFRSGMREPYRDKDVRSLVRAGFPLALARTVVDGER